MSATTVQELPETKAPFDWKRALFLLGGLALFFIIYYCPAWPDAIDPKGEHFILTKQAKGALAVFAVAATWWIFEVVPIGVTSLLIGSLQALFLIRKPAEAFKDFMDPSVLFIFGSVVIGMVFTKTGLTRRIAYKMLSLLGQKTPRPLLGCFLMPAALTHVMAHTAVAATMFPLLMAIYAMYTTDSKPTQFGKALFIGLAYVAGAGSIITLLGSARAAVALAFYKDMTGMELTPMDLTFYMAPLGWLMTFILWGFFMFFLKPEKDRIPGLKEKATRMYKELGGMTRKEISAAIIIAIAVILIALKSLLPALDSVDKTGILLSSTIAFFVFNILDLEDLEEIPWNIVLLFAGAMSIGFCLWQTGAAKWLAVNWLVLFQKAPGVVFILGMAFFVLIMTNFIMNVAAIAISLPVALVIAPYLGVGPQVILFSALATAGMPFILLIGAAPNAIAYNSKQFTTGEFLKYGTIASIILMAVLWVFVAFIWPMMGMKVFV